MTRKSRQHDTIQLYAGVELHPGQQEVYDCPARFIVVDCGRRWGKSQFAKIVLAAGSGRGESWSYMAPSYKMLDEVWRDTKALLAPVTARKDEQQHRLELITGGSLDFWSLVDPDSPRGRKYHGVVVDEAAILPNGDPWQKVIRPTLIDYKGRAYFLSTPRGHNWFWGLFRLGKDPLELDWASFKRPTLNNPYIPPEEVEDARRNTPERIFKQEYEADFIDDAGSVFRNLASVASGVAYQNRAIPGHQYVFGIDPAKSNDFLVVAIYDATIDALVAMDRSNHLDYQFQAGRIKTMAELFMPTGIVVEQNANLAFVEMLQALSLPIIPFQTSLGTKMTIIEHLSSKFDKEEVHIIDDPQLMGELEAFQMDRTAGGMFRYGAPAGEHDDTVMGLALAVWGATYHAAAWEPFIL